MRHAVVNNDTKKVTNVVIWDGKDPWQPPKNHTIIRSDECNMHDTWDETTNKFTRPTKTSP